MESCLSLGRLGKACIPPDKKQKFLPHSTKTLCPRPMPARVQSRISPILHMQGVPFPWFFPLLSLLSQNLSVNKICADCTASLFSSRVICRLTCSFISTVWLVGSILFKRSSRETFSLRIKSCASIFFLFLALLLCECQPLQYILKHNRSWKWSENMVLSMTKTQ